MTFVPVRTLEEAQKLAQAGMTQPGQEGEESGKSGGKNAPPK